MCCAVPHLSIDFAQLIHEHDQNSLPVVITIFTYTSCLSVRPSVHPYYSKYRKTIQISSKNTLATGGHVGMAEGIIDDTNVLSSFTNKFKKIRGKGFPWPYFLYIRLCFHLKRKKLFFSGVGRVIST